MSIFQGMPICLTLSRIQIDMATINVDFPRFLLAEVMPQRDTLKYSSTFLHSDGIETRCFLEEQGVSVIFFQKMNVKSLPSSTHLLAHVGCLSNNFRSIKCWIEFAFDQTFRPTILVDKSMLERFAALPTKLSTSFPGLSRTRPRGRVGKNHGNDVAKFFP